MAQINFIIAHEYILTFNTIFKEIFNILFLITFLRTISIDFPITCFFPLQGGYRHFISKFRPFSIFYIYFPAFSLIFQPH